MHLSSTNNHASSFERKAVAISSDDGIKVELFAVAQTKPTGKAPFRSV